MLEHILIAIVSGLFGAVIALWIAYNNLDI